MNSSVSVNSFVSINIRWRCIKVCEQWRRPRLGKWLGEFSIPFSAVLSELIQGFPIKLKTGELFDESAGVNSKTAKRYLKTLMIPESANLYRRLRYTFSGFLFVCKRIHC